MAYKGTIKEFMLEEVLQENRDTRKHEGGENKIHLFLSTYTSSSVEEIDFLSVLTSHKCTYSLKSWNIS